MEYILCEKISDFHFSLTSFFPHSFFFAHFPVGSHFFFLLVPLRFPSTLIYIQRTRTFSLDSADFSLTPNHCPQALPSPFCGMKIYTSVTSATGVHLGEIRFLENCLNVFTVLGAAKWGCQNDGKYLLFYRGE